MYDLSKYEQLSHTNRSFNMDHQVDDRTYNSLIQIIDDFLDTAPYAKKFILTDRQYIEILYEAAFSYPFSTKNYTEKQRMTKRVSAQMLAPLLISVYCPTSYDNNWIHIGRLYSKLALFAIEQGYHIGFNNGNNYPMLKMLFKPDKFPFECQQHTFLSIGNKLKIDSPHNWAHVTDTIMPSFKKSTDEFIQILN